MYYPGSDHFLIPDPDPNIFTSRILHEKWNAKLLFSCFLCFQQQSLILSLGKKFRDPEKIHPGSGSRIKGVKKRLIRIRNTGQQHQFLSQKIPVPFAIRNEPKLRTTAISMAPLFNDVHCKEI
jgi:hypothetical protein